MFACRLLAAERPTPAHVAASTAATAPVAPPDMPLDAAAREQAIAELAVQMSASYVFPEVAEKMNAAIRARQLAGDYDRIGSAQRFAELLGTHLQQVSHDKHIRVNFRPEALPREAAGGAAPPDRAAQRERALAFGRKVNFGFAKYEQLEGNVAYLELRSFFDADTGAQTAAAAMNLVANADALIIDLRRNGGGSPEMVALVSS